LPTGKKRKTYVHAIVESLLHGSKEDIIASDTSASKDTVGSEGDLRGNTDPRLGRSKITRNVTGITTDNTGNVGSVSLAIHGVRVRGRLVVTVVGITDKVPTVLDTAVLAVAGEASLLGALGSESGMLVVDTGIDDTDLDALTGQLELSVDNVNTGHVVEGCGLRVSGLDGALLDLGDRVEGDGPDVLDTGDGGEGVTVVARLDGNGSTVEDVVLVAELVVDLAGVQGVSGIGMADVIVVLDNVLAGSNLDSEVLDVVELASGNQGGCGKGRENGGDLHVDV
jgi:hypothetical protein